MIEPIESWRRKAGSMVDNLREKLQATGRGNPYLKADHAGNDYRERQFSELNNRIEEPLFADDYDGYRKLAESISYSRMQPVTTA